MGGYRVTETTERFLTSIYESLKKHKKNPSAQKVLDTAHEYLAIHKRNDIFLPQIRKTQQIISNIIKPKELSREEKIQQENWSMGSLPKYLLPAESIPYIMQVWRYCCHTDEIFTIRQAKWVSRLFRFPYSEFTTRLWCISYIYSKKEELSVISQIDPDTFFDDVNLVMHGLEQQTFLEILHKEPDIDPFGIGLPINDEDNWPIEEALHPIDYYNAILNGIVSNERDKDLINKLIKIPALPRLMLGTEMEMIYLDWFTFIRKSEYWPYLNAEHALDIILKLRDWAVKQKSIIQVAERPIKYNVEFVKKRGHKLTFKDELPTPDEVLNLLSEYANKEVTK